MFGKQQADVCTESDVGDYIDELKQQGEKELEDFVLDKDEEE